ncbi:hypothetical protein L6V77_03450 [Myxococcota bacterium]|nr:hypothetical protein [Myxococcota bacterium]
MPAVLLTQFLPHRVEACDGQPVRRTLGNGSRVARAQGRWWSIPQRDGATIEFATVAAHDEFSTPV